MNTDKLQKIAIILLYIERKSPQSVNQVLHHLGVKIGQKVIEQMQLLDKITSSQLEEALEEIKQVFSMEEFSAGSNLIKKISSEINKKRKHSDNLGATIELFHVFKEYPMSDIKELMQHDPSDVLLRCYRHLSASDLSDVLEKLDVKEAAEVTKALMEPSDRNTDLMFDFDIYLEKRCNDVLARKSKDDSSSKKADKASRMMRKLSQGYERLDVKKQEELLASLDKAMREEILKRVLRVETFANFDADIREGIITELDDLDILVHAMKSYDGDIEREYTKVLSPRQQEIYKEKSGMDVELTDQEKLDAERRLIIFIRNEARKQGVKIDELLNPDTATNADEEKEVA